MNIGKELAGWLRSRATLVAMLDKDAKQAPRIHPRRLPQTAKPQGEETSVRAIIYHKISDISQGSLSGVASPSEALLQFDCYGSTPDKADTLREMLKSHLDSVVSGSIGNTRLLFLIHEGDRDEHDDPQDGTDIARFVSQCDYRVMYQRTS